MKAKDIMTNNVVTVTEENTVKEVLEILLENRISGVPVINSDNEVIGIVSEADLIYRDRDISLPAYVSLLEGFIMLESMKKFEDKLRKKVAYKVKDVMTSLVVKVNENEDVHKIANIMLEKKINRVPVVDDDEKLVGIITRSNILKSF